LALPQILVDELRQHIARYVGPGSEGLVFSGPKGAPLRRGNFGRSTKWKDVVAAVGLPAGFHFHDLRHTGNQLAAASGAPHGNSCTDGARIDAGRTDLPARD
jgi:integrase